jgi:hypothetical protein
MPRKSMSGPPFPLQPHSTTVECGATQHLAMPARQRVLYKKGTNKNGIESFAVQRVVAFWLYQPRKRVMDWLYLSEAVR